MCHCWWLCFRLSLEGRSLIVFSIVSTFLVFRTTRFDPWDCSQVEKESCDTRNGDMENSSWIIRNTGYRYSQTCSTSVPFWASTGSKGHWIVSNLEMQKRNAILLMTGVAFSSSFVSGRSMAVGGVGVNGPCSQLPGCQLSDPVVPQQQVLLSLASVPLWGAHRHCFPLSNLHLSQFLQAAELAVVPCNKKRICMGWTGIYMCCKEAFPHPFWEQQEAVLYRPFNASKVLSL